jgi:hypothetical protein
LPYWSGGKPGRRRSWAAVASAIALFLPPPASAMDACSGLKYALEPQFRDVVQCLVQLNEAADTQNATIYALEAENQLLKAYICSLAIDSLDKPDSLGASIYHEDCPKPRPKAVPKPTPNKKQ